MLIDQKKTFFTKRDDHDAKIVEKEKESEIILKI